MSSLRGIAGVVLLLWLASVVPAHAIWMDLTPEQAKRAEKVGGFNASAADPTRFMKPWVVNLGDGKGGALLMTEFLSVAFAAQEASRNFAALQPWDRDDAVSRARGKLVFSVTTFDKRATYADGLRGYVEYNGKRIQNTHWQNGKAESHPKNGFMADSTFWFSANGIDPNGEVTLVVEQKQIDRTWRFPFDLSKMR